MPCGQPTRMVVKLPTSRSNIAVPAPLLAPRFEPGSVSSREYESVAAVAAVARSPRSPRSRRAPARARLQVQSPAAQYFMRITMSCASISAPWPRKSRLPLEPTTATLASVLNTPRSLSTPRPASMPSADGAGTTAVAISRLITVVTYLLVCTGGGHPQAGRPSPRSVGQSVGRARLCPPSVRRASVGRSVGRRGRPVPRLRAWVSCRFVLMRPDGLSLAARARRSIERVISRLSITKCVSGVTKDVNRVSKPPSFRLLWPSPSACVRLA